MPRRGHPAGPKSRPTTPISYRSGRSVLLIANRPGPVGSSGLKLVGAGFASLSGGRVGECSCDCSRLGTCSTWGPDALRCLAGLPLLGSGRGYSGEFAALFGGTLGCVRAIAASWCRGRPGCQMRFAVWPGLPLLGSGREFLRRNRFALRPLWPGLGAGRGSLGEFALFFAVWF